MPTRLDAIRISEKRVLPRTGVALGGAGAGGYDFALGQAPWKAVAV